MAAGLTMWDILSNPKEPDKLDTLDIGDHQQTTLHPYQGDRLGWLRYLTEQGGERPSRP